jgi:hypothetical protein
MSCLALAMLDCVAMALISRPFIALDSELLKELGVGAPLGKEEDTSVVEGEEESLPLELPPPKKPPKDMVCEVGGLGEGSRQLRGNGCLRGQMRVGLR